jgi:hypothetical protein
VNDGVAGTCEPTGGCSFPDDSCGSGRRYGAHAPDGLAGTCASAEVATVTTEDVSDSLSASASVTVTLTSLGSSDSGSADSTTMAVSASAGSETSTGLVSTSGSTSDEGGTSESTGGSVAEFFDPFDRPNGPDLGNGWIEKTPGAFRILDEQVEFDTVNGEDFRDNLFYRPLAESLLDVEASVVVDFVADDPFGFPQLHTRVQADDVATLGSLTSYVVFVDSDDPLDPRLTVNRIAGGAFGPGDSVSIAPPPVAVETYRLRSRVTGTDPVTVEGFFEVLVSDAWEVRTEVMLVDVAEDRIVVAGTMGGGGHVALQHFVLDDFSYTPIE